MTFLQSLFFSFVFMVTIVAIPLSASAQDQPSFSTLSTVDPNEEDQILPPVDVMAKQYYDRCMSKPDASLTYQAQDDFCVCTTVKILENLEPKQIQGLAEGKGLKDLEPTDWSVKVQAPCLYTFAPEVVNRECRSDDKLRYIIHTSQALDATCNCVTAGAKIYFKKYAAIQIAALQKSGFNVLDPLDAVRRSADYMRDYQNSLKACASKYKNVK
jgi:hypothetical protein